MVHFVPNVGEMDYLNFQRLELPDSKNSKGWKFGARRLPVTGNCETEFLDGIHRIYGI